jgi:hypothetical protein
VNDDSVYVTFITNTSLTHVMFLLLHSFIAPWMLACCWSKHCESLDSMLRWSQMPKHSWTWWCEGSIECPWTPTWWTSSLIISFLELDNLLPWARLFRFYCWTNQYLALSWARKYLSSMNVILCFVGPTSAASKQSMMPVGTFTSTLSYKKGCTWVNSTN